MGADSIRGVPLPRLLQKTITAPGKTSRLVPPASVNENKPRPGTSPRHALPSAAATFDQRRFGESSFDESRFDSRRQGEKLVDPNQFDWGRFGPTWDTFAVAEIYTPESPEPTDLLKVPKGQLTFDAEGSEQRGVYFSRIAHWPGAKSGVTIGRGYDMKEREPQAVIAELTAAGVPRADAERLAQGAKLEEDAAHRFLAEVKDIEITLKAQNALFITVYDELAADAQRLANKADVVEAYGATDWENLDPAIKDILVDLRYRGEYNGTTRKDIQPLVVANDLQGLHDLLADEDKMTNDWGVPPDRFERRRNHLADALASQAALKLAQ